MLKNGQQYEIYQDAKLNSGGSWNWSVWVEGAADILDKINYVIYTLHPSYSVNERKVTDRQTKFRLDEEAWAPFTIYVRVLLKNDSTIDLEYELKLTKDKEEASVEFVKEAKASFEVRAATSLLGTTPIDQARKLVIKENDIIELVFEDSTTWICNASTLEKIFPQTNHTR